MNYLEALLNHRGETPKVSDSVGWGGDPRIFISNKCPGDAPDHTLKTNALDQESAKYSIWVQIGPLFVFVNKVLLEHIYAHLLYISSIHSCFCTITAELSGYDRDYIAHKA